MIETDVLLADLARSRQDLSRCEGSRDDCPVVEVTNRDNLGVERRTDDEGGPGQDRQPCGGGIEHGPRADQHLRVELVASRPDDLERIGHRHRDPDEPDAAAAQRTCDRDNVGCLGDPDHGHNAGLLEHAVSLRSGGHASPASSNLRRSTSVQWRCMPRGVLDCETPTATDPWTSNTPGTAPSAR